MTKLRENPHPLETYNQIEGGRMRESCTKVIQAQCVFMKRQKMGGGLYQRKFYMLYINIFQMLQF